MRTKTNGLILQAIGGLIVWLGLAIPFPSQVRAAEPPVSPASAAWRLVWSDEFKQPDGSAPDPQKWAYDTGGNGWGNEELEYYTSRTNNVRIEGGKLVIEARKEGFENRNYTSGRLTTLKKFSATYGRFEARIKIPYGQGVWPAFWLLGTNLVSVGWPACGEIDIMENVGNEPGTVHGTVHGPGHSGAYSVGGPSTLPRGAALAKDYHNFAVECEPNRITWYLDGNAYFTVTPSNLPKNSPWIFNKPKFLILNLAIGGKWPGNPDATTRFPQRMIVEYVRVYERSTVPEASK